MFSDIDRFSLTDSELMTGKMQRIKKIQLLSKEMEFPQQYFEKIQLFASKKEKYVLRYLLFVLVQFT